MKIVLISPRGPLYRHRGGIWRKSLRYAPLTLTTLAALVPQELNAEIVLYDEGVEDVPDDIEADIIGISIITGSSKRGYELADKFRKQGKIVVLGGVHATLLPEEAAAHADAVVVGYAEKTWPQLLKDFKEGKLRKFYRQAQPYLINLPIPRRELLKRDMYLTMNTVEATRGCTYRCEFCVVTTAWGDKQFQRPIMDVVSEIKQLKARDVLFIDLNLIADVDYAKRLFKALAPLKIRWGGLTTVQIGWDDELLDLCAKSGCKGLLMGFESLSRENLLLTSKAFNLVKDYKDVIKRLHEKGVRIMGCFVFGLDDDDKTVFKRTVDFCIDAKIDLPRFAIVTPFPNTPLYNRLKAEGRVLTEDWSLYDAQHVVFQPKHMTAEELYRGTEWAWKRVYSYSAIFRRLSGTKWPFIESLKYALPANLGYRFYSRRLSKFYTCGAVNPARL